MAAPLPCTGRVWWPAFFTWGGEGGMRSAVGVGEGHACYDAKPASFTRVSVKRACGASTEDLDVQHTLRMQMRCVRVRGRDCVAGRRRELWVGLGPQPPALAPGLGAAPRARPTPPPACPWTGGWACGERGAVGTVKYGRQGPGSRPGKSDAVMWTGRNWHNGIMLPTCSVRSATPSTPFTFPHPPQPAFLPAPGPHAHPPVIGAF